LIVIARAVVDKGLGMSRFVRPILQAFCVRPIALAAAVCLASSGLVGCTNEPGFEPDSTETVDDELRNYEQTAQALADDPRFTTLLHTGVIVAKQQLVGQAQMDPVDLDAYVRTITTDGYGDEIELDDLLAFAGVEQNLVNQQSMLTQELIFDYGLSNLGAADLEAVFSMAAETPQSEAQLAGMIEYELLPLTEPYPVEDNCKEVCRVQFVFAAGLAVKAYIAALAGATAGGPAGIIAAIVATAAYAYALAEANATLERCFAECDGELPSTEECLRDLDCAANEYCWKGVLGFGTHECRPKKDLSGTCSRHEQCASGCCKYHLWTHPFSKVCRPSSKCG
jgi:hypothetical protein